MKLKPIYLAMLLCALTCLNACIPYVSSYQKIEVADATYLHSGCQSELGPDSMAYYPFHGIYISIDMLAPRLGLHIPSGTIVELNDMTMKIDGLIGTTPYQATIELRAFSHASFGVGYEPAKFMESIDHYTKPDNYGPLEGGGNGKYLLWYSYLMKDEDSQKIYSVPKGLTEGTVEIPTMTINGQRYDSQKLRFKREAFIALAAVNC